MTLTYHSGRRIQGISHTARQAGSGLTFSDDFSSDKGWETSSSTYMDYDSGNSRLKTHWKGDGAGNNYTVVYDLGEGMVSDTKWILRMKINFGSTDGADNEGFIGLSDSDETKGKETAQDFAGVCFLAGYSTTAWNGFYECEADGAVLPPTAGNNAAYNFSDSTDYYLEIKRTSATGLTYTVYSDAYSTSLATQSVTIASTVSGLRYIKFANYPAAATNCTGAYADDIQFYNDVTSTSTTPVAEVPASGDIKPTNVQVGSRLEETDTRKMYNFSKLTFDFSASSSGAVSNQPTDATEVGQLITSTTHRGEKAKSATFYVKRTGSPGGTMVYKIRKSSDNSVVATSTGTSASALSTSTTAVTLDFNDEVIPSENVRVTVSGVTGSSGNVVTIYGGGADTVADQSLSVWGGSSWTEYGNDCAGKLTFTEEWQEIGA